MPRPSLHQAIAARTTATLEAGETRRAELAATLDPLAGLAQLADDIDANPTLADSLTQLQRSALAAYRVTRTNRARHTNQAGGAQ